MFGFGKKKWIGFEPIHLQNKDLYAGIKRTFLQKKGRLNN
jgi:hypothetical protein